MKITKKEVNELTYRVNGAAIEVHKRLGPGLLESIYHKCLAHELSRRNIRFSSEVNIPIHYKDVNIDAKIKCDLYVENCLVVEIKAIENVLPIHHAQLLTYMKLLEAPKGLILNFHCVNIYTQGQKTFVNEYYRSLDDE